MTGMIRVPLVKRDRRMLDVDATYAAINDHAHGRHVKLIQERIAADRANSVRWWRCPHNPAQPKGCCQSLCGQPEPEPAF